MRAAAMMCLCESAGLEAFAGTVQHLCRSVGLEALEESYAHDRRRQRMAYALRLKQACCFNDVPRNSQCYCMAEDPAPQGPRIHRSLICLVTTEFAASGSSSILD